MRDHHLFFKRNKSVKDFLIFRWIMVTTAKPGMLSRFCFLPEQEDILLLTSTHPDLTPVLFQCVIYVLLHLTTKQIHTLTVMQLSSTQRLYHTAGFFHVLGDSINNVKKSAIFITQRIKIQYSCPSVSEGGELQDFPPDTKSHRCSSPLNRMTPFVYILHTSSHIL
jgi:hypothetical protein